MTTYMVYLYIQYFKSLDEMTAYGIFLSPIFQIKTQESISVYKWTRSLYTHIVHSPLNLSIQLSNSGQRIETARSAEF